MSIAVTLGVAGIVALAVPSAPVSAVGASHTPRLVAGGGELGHAFDGSPAACPNAPGCSGQQAGRITYPLGMAVHPVSGEFYFSQGAFENNSDLNDYNRSIRLVDSSGNLLTVVGDNSQTNECTSSCDGAVTTASQQLRRPGQMAFTADGTYLYVLDAQNGVRKITFAGTPARPTNISTVTYTSLPTGFVGLSDLVAYGGLAIGSNGDIFFAGANFNSSGDYHRSVFKRSAAGALTELFTTSGVNGTTQMNGGSNFEGPKDLKIVNDKLYVAYATKIVRSSLSGTVEAVYTVTGNVRSVAVMGSTVFVGFINDGTVKKFADNAANATPVSPTMTTLLGTSAQTFAIGQTQASVELTGPRAMMVDGGSLYISDMKSLFSAIVALDAPPATAPTISGQPAGSSKTAGESITFSVTATSSDGGTLSYQWKKGGSAISGATSSSFTINSLTTGDSGSYTVEVTNTVGSTTASATSSAATLTVSAAPAPTTTTVVSPTPSAAAGSSSTPAAVVPGAPSLVTSANQAELEADPGEAVAVINGKSVTVETVKSSADATPAEQLETAKKIVSEIAEVIPSGGKNPIAVVSTSTGAEISGLMVNPEDPTEKLNVPVDSVTLVKAGDSKVLISALNQTNLPAEVVSGGVLQVTRGGVVAARAYGLPGAESGEIVLMSTPRLLKTFTVDQNGSYNGQVPLPKDITFGTHTVVMATKNAKVSLGIKLVRTRMLFRVKRTISTAIFKNRAGVVKKGGGKVSVSGSGRCRATLTKVKMSAKTGACYVTVRQAAKGTNKAIFYRFTVSVVKKLPRKSASKTK